MKPSKTSSTSPHGGRPDQFKSGVHKRLKPVINWLEQDRAQMQRQTLALVAGIAILTGTLAWFAWTLNANPLIHAALLALALVLVRAVQVKLKLEPSQSRTQIVSRFAKALGPKFVTLPNGGISEADVIQSRLFTDLLRSFHSSNQLRGKIAKVQLELSEVHASAETGQRQPRALFDGLWIIASFPASFRTSTIIRPVSDALESAQAGFRTVKLEEASFARLFDVSAEDGVEAQYVLSSRLLARIKAFHDAGNQKPFLAFEQQRLHIGIPQPNLTGPAFAQALLEALDLTIGLVRELEANTFIWNKPSLEPRPVGPEVLEFALHTTQERNPAVGPRYRKPSLEPVNPDPVQPDPVQPDPVQPAPKASRSALSSSLEPVNLVPEKVGSAKD
jgi:hypothetical protein